MSSTPCSEPAYSAEVLAAVEQIQDMPRGAVMKNIAGPVIARLLSPVYEPAITTDEENRIFPVTSFVDMHGFADSVTSLLGQRLDPERHLVRYSPPGEQLKRHPDYSFLEGVAGLSEDHNRRLFTFSPVEKTLSEGLDSSVVIPLTLASHIYRVENDVTGLVVHDIAVQHIDPLNIAQIMRRNTFDTILMRLTKGPNGFLGGGSTRLGVCTDNFFAFEKNVDQPLKIKEAFALTDGQVVDFSALYHIVAAARRRQVIYHMLQMADVASADESISKTYYINSSGCPVRHEFTGPDGTPQESLILTAKNFLISALEVSARRAATMSEGTA